MPSATKLPPLPDNVLDGVKESKTIEYPKCTHKDGLKIIDGNNLRCSKCNAGWQGANIKQLYELLTK